VPTIDVGGIATYHEVHGEGEPLLLIHGGFCSIETLRPQIEFFSPRYQVLAPELPGHGRTPDRDGPMSYPADTSHTLGYLDAVGVERAHIVGFSDGAIVGMMLAMQHPRRVASLVSIGGSLDRDAVVEGELAARAMSQEAFEGLLAQYDELSPDGPGHRAAILAKHEAMWTGEPYIDAADLAAIACQTLVLAGDHDLIRLDHTALIASSIPGAAMGIVPDASHMLMQERAPLVNAILDDFLSRVRI
jgi:pimeloyl-ACP methyl ester carboxylesterase